MFTIFLSLSLPILSMLSIGSILMVFEKSNPLSCQGWFWVCEAQLTKPPNRGMYSRFGGGIGMVNCVLNKPFCGKLLD